MPPVVFLCLLASGCGDRGDEPRETLSVSAAASLREVLAEVEARYEAAYPGVDVRLNLGASGALRRQIEQGAPADVFVSAAEEPMAALIAGGHVDPRSRRALAGNELVVAVPAGRASPVRDVRDLARPAVQRVALGAPASVPAGAYADEALRSLGIARQVRAKAVLAQDVRQALAFVASGNADAAIVYRTDAASTDRVRVAASVHPSLHRPIVYPVAVATRAVHPARARSFVAFLLGAEGRAALRGHGFRVE